ncbi:CBS domain-containing protein [Actinoplanes sp. G11-F43]|uniref:CBS domain-containing protein n=1 Tax=Actinoplanes sp. G11-F43 TaxID=3424130 RepID=UPI003D33B4BC
MRLWHVNDVMTSDVAAVEADTPYRDVADLLASRRVNAVPVVDADRHVLGVVSESDLLRKIEFVGSERPRWFERRKLRQHRKAAGRTAGELMTSPTVIALTSTSVPVAARRMAEAGVKQLPVLDDLGRLVGIVSRGDLLKEHQRPDDEIRADVTVALSEALLAENWSTITAVVERGAVTLTGRVERWSTAILAARRIRMIPGVVEVTETVEFDVDDQAMAAI